MPKAPPYPVTEDPYVDRMFRELYARVQVIEVAAGINPDVVTPPSPSDLTFDVDAITPIRYIEVRITQNNVWKWWDLFGIPGPVGALDPVPLIKVFAPATVRIFKTYTGITPLDAAAVLNAAAVYDLHIGESIDGVLSFNDAFNTSAKFAQSGDLRFGEPQAPPETEVPLGYVAPDDPGGQTLFERTFTEDTILFGAFWVDWASPIPSTWTDMAGSLSTRIGFTSFPPTEIKTAAQLAEEIIYVREPLIPVP